MARAGVCGRGAAVEDACTEVGGRGALRERRSVADTETFSESPMSGMVHGR